MSEERSLILAAATGYSWPQMAPFVQSLRKTGYAGDVLLLTARLPTETRARVEAANIQLWDVFPLLSHIPTWWRRKLFSRRLGWVHRNYPTFCDAFPFGDSNRASLLGWLGRPFLHISCARYYFFPLLF